MVGLIAGSFTVNASSPAAGNVAVGGHKAATAWNQDTSTWTDTNLAGDATIEVPSPTFTMMQAYDLPRFPRAPRWDKDPDFDARVSALRTVRDAAAHRLEDVLEVVAGRKTSDDVTERALSLPIYEKLTGLEFKPAVDMREAMQSQRPLAEVSSAMRNAALEITRPAVPGWSAVFGPPISAPGSGRSKKTPTPAHRAIASLVKAGYIRVIVTTNFDRLVEQALTDAGVPPQERHARASELLGMLGLAAIPLLVLRDELLARRVDHGAHLVELQEVGVVFHRAAPPATGGLRGQRLAVRRVGSRQPLHAGAPRARTIVVCGVEAHICVAGTVLGLVVDVEKRRPRLAFGTGGLSGPAIRPIAVRMAWQAANAVKIPVIGCGGIGLNAIQGAMLSGAHKIIACDLLDNKLAMAKTFGATLAGSGEGPFLRTGDLGHRDTEQDPAEAGPPGVVAELEAVGAAVARVETPADAGLVDRVPARSHHVAREQRGAEYQPAEAAVQHLAHHGVVVARHQVLGSHVELAVLPFDEPLRAGHDHRPDLDPHR